MNSCSWLSCSAVVTLMVRLPGSCPQTRAVRLTVLL